MRVCTWWEARYVTVAVAAMVFSRAVPMEAPICWEVLVMAEVTPTSCGSAFWVAVLMQGTKASPSPKPRSSSLGSTLVQ